MVSKILVFGLTTLDIINICEYYPPEDGDVRAVKQIWQKGGNAANTSQVLAQQKDTKVDLFSCFVKVSPQSDFCRLELKKQGVNIENCIVLENCAFPTSCCIVAHNTGSRTIIHCRNNMPELTFEHFSKVDLSRYKWVHFEGRGLPHLKDMIIEASRVRDSSEKLEKISVEFEKPARQHELISSNIASFVDVLFVSKDIATNLGYSSAHETVKDIKNKLNLPSSLIVICAWGEAGADAIDENDVMCHSHAFPPETIMDTLGAGDTFNAGVLHCLMRGFSLQSAISFGCKIAGRKCGQHGFDNLCLEP